MDLSTLPPCQSTLKLHIFHANRVAYLMKRSSVAQVEEPPLSDCGWDHEERIIWTEKTYPSAVEELLVDSHKADESVKVDVDEYFRDNCIVMNMIEIRVTFAILNLLDQFYLCLTS